MDKNKVKITMEDGGEIVVVLDEKNAPISVFYAVGVKNNLSHRRGVISMARANDFDSASSQFFICHKDATFLDGQYAAFGVAESGLDVVDRIAAVPTDANDRPKKEQKIKSVRFAD